MNQHSRARPVVLCVLDGWGHRETCKNNAICLARTPVLDRLAGACPNALLDASAREVGLPPGQMGNSEVGHMNLGAGRVVTQDLPRIDAAIESGELAGKAALARFIERGSSARSSWFKAAMASVSRRAASRYPATDGESKTRSR